MKTVAALLLAPAILFAPGMSSKPAPVKLARVAIPGCQCSLLAPPGFTFEAPETTEDGIKFFEGAAKVGDDRVGILAIRFPERVEGDADVLQKVLEDILVKFREEVGAKATSGDELGYRDTSSFDPWAHGYTQFWEDGEDPDLSWNVKAWISPTHVGIVYIQTNSSAFKQTALVDSYWDGFKSDLPKKPVPTPTPVPTDAPLTRREIPGCGCSVLAPADIELAAPEKLSAGHTRYVAGGTISGRPFRVVAQKYAQFPTKEDEILDMFSDSFRKKVQEDFAKGNNTSKVSRRSKEEPEHSRISEEEWKESITDDEPTYFVTVYSSVHYVAALYIERNLKDTRRPTPGERKFLESFQFHIE